MTVKNAAPARSRAPAKTARPRTAPKPAFLRPGGLRNIRIVLEYEGTAYNGWQAQESQPTVQGEVRKALRALTGEDPVVYGASRTDAGVHSLGQTANFRTASRIPAERFAYALNAHLPPDIRVVHSTEVPHDFHAQFHARWKLYRYTVLNRPFGSAVLRNFVHHLRGPLDLSRMRRAARFIVGTRDFRSFGTASADRDDCVRTVFHLSVARTGDCVVFEIAGNGFLYAMVRTIVGTLLEVGMGKRMPGDIPRILEAKDRRAAGPTAPARGLCLVRVGYQTWKCGGRGPGP